MVLQQWTGWSKKLSVELQFSLLLQHVAGPFQLKMGMPTDEAKDYHFNIIDTPGHVDFTVEVNRSLRVLDGLVFLFSAVDGVEPQSETNWRLADNYKVPRMGFVNKMDRQGSNFLAVCQQVKDMLKSNAVPIVLPIGDEVDFKGVVDLVKNRAIVWHEATQGATFDIVDIPADMVDDVRKYRGQLIEEVAAYDESLLEKYMEDEDSITEDEIHAGFTCCSYGYVYHSYDLWFIV